MTEAAATRKKLVVIDGKSVFYRGYYAMPNLSTKDGLPTGGVYGFATMALEVVKQLKPDYVAVAWDKPKTNIRRRLELYPEYKAGRKPAPPDFYEQIPLLHELLEAFGWPLYELDDYEADDIMGTLAIKANEHNVDTLLVTSDLDLLQVVNTHTKVYALKRGFSDIQMYSPQSFEAKYGIDVEQFLDYKALIGDSSDNIPGVAGIGPVAARQLLGEFKTLDAIYDNLGLIKDATRRKLEAGKDSAYMSKELAAIWTNAPIDFDEEALDGRKARPDKILELLKRFEFRTLARQLPEVMQVSGESLPTAAHATAELQLAKNTLIDTPAKLGELKLKGDQLFVHSRCAGPHGQSPQVLILSDAPDCVYTLDLDKLPASDLVLLLGPYLEDKDIAKIGHDVKATMQLCLELGLQLGPVGHDTLIGSFVLNSLRREQGLSELAASDLGYDGSPFDDMDKDEVMSRAPEIIAVLRGLYAQQAAEFDKIPTLQKMIREIDWPVIPVLARMEHAGILLDKAYLADFSSEIDNLIADYEAQIYEHAGQEFNIGSPGQLAEILFEKLDLPKQGIKKGKTSYSTAAAELDKLRGQHPIIDLITQYREVAKLKSTYVDTLPKQADSRSRVHTTFNLTIAQTGRLSSIDPNLQNIPTRTDLGRRVRTAFVAGKGNKFVSADYSQFELRLAAVMAEDKELIDMFNRGADVHIATAAQVYGREQEDVTKQMRRAAKVINFGILYGMSVHGLTAATGMSYEQANNFINRYKELRRPLFDYMNRIKEFAKKEGYVETIFGRRRPMPDIHSSNFMVRSAAERAAINMPIQGTEADLMKLAMVRVDEKLQQFKGARQLLQVHDSILVECPEAMAGDIAAMLQDTMEHVYDLPVKLTVDTTTGDNWGEL